MGEDHVDEALDQIATKITENKDKYGAESFASIKGTGPGLACTLSICSLESSESQCYQRRPPHLRGTH